MWIGGPADGQYLTLADQKPFRVIGGSTKHPEYRIITPKQLATGKWILNFYEGVIEE